MDMLTSMNKAIDYMEEHLVGDIDLAEVTKVAGCTQTHLNRMFLSITDVTVSEYIRRRRMTLAAGDLLNTEMSILDIALKYGYQSPDSFCRAFKAQHGVTPSQARKYGVNLTAYGKITFILSIKGVTAMNYRLEEKEAIRVVGVKKWFCSEGGQQLNEIPKMWDEFPPDKEETLDEISKNHAMVGLCADMYDNGFDYWIGTMTEEPCPEGFEEITIPACTWAIFEAIGVMRPLPNSLQEIWGRIYSEWLPNSGYQHAMVPEIEYYPVGDMMDPKYKCEVWIPIVK